LLDGNFEAFYIYIGIDIPDSLTSGCGTLKSKSGVQPVRVRNFPIADLGTQSEEHDMS